MRLPFLASWVAWLLSLTGLAYADGGGGWISSATGEWRFEDISEQAWEYKNHGWSRQFLFALEQFYAPHLADDNAVAWAYRPNDIKGHEIRNIMEAILDKEAAIAVQSNDSYVVFPDTIVRPNIEEWNASTLQDRLAELNNIYIVSREKLPNSIIEERADIISISSRGDSAVPISQIGGLIR